MKKIKTSLIRQAFAIVEERELRYLDSLPEVFIPHSSEYNAKINELLAKNKRNSASLKPRLVFAVIIVIIALAITACTFVKPITRFLEEIHDSFVNLLTKEEEEVITKIYTPSYLPSGYELESQKVYDTSAGATWTNGEDSIFLYQRPLKNGHIAIDSEGAEQGYIYIEEQALLYVRKNGIYVFTWENGAYAFQLRCSDKLPFDEIEKIISGIIE